MSHLPAVIERTELVPREPETPAVLDAGYRVVAARPYAGPVQRSRSVVLPAGLLALAILGVPLAVFAALVWSSQP